MMIGGVILLLLGVAAYALARRGRLVGSHPCCAKCGFDLFGLPEGRARCPECGADILRDGAVGVGIRRPVFWGMCVAAFVMLCGLSLGGAGVVNWWLHFDGIRWKTVGMLIGDLRSTGDATRGKAAKELRRRADAGALSRASAARVADSITAWQADPAIPWDYCWGDVLQEERRDRLLPEALWNRYLAQGMQVTMRSRPRVGGYGVVSMEVACVFKGGGYGDDLVATITPTLKFSGDGKQKTLPLPPSTFQYARWGVAWDGGDDPGKHTVHVDLSVALEERTGGRAHATRSWDIAYEQLPSGKNSVTLHTASPAEQAEMDRAIEWRLKTLPDGHLLIQPRARAAAGTLRIVGPPFPVSVTILLRQNGREWLVGVDLVRVNDAQPLLMDLPASDPGQGPQPGPAELVCVPDVTQAEMTMDVTEIWGGEIHKAVVLERPGQ